MIIRTSTLSVQKSSKGTLRIWVEGKYLEKAGFQKGQRYSIDYNSKQLLVTLDPGAKRKISERRKNPIIDINNTKLSELFSESEKVNVVVKLGKIFVEKSKIFTRKITAPRNKKAASVFGGGGLIDLAAEKNNFKMAWSIEQEKKFADVWQANFAGTMYNCDVAEVDYDSLEKVQLLLAGIPCDPHSKANRTTEGIHPNIDATLFLMMIIEKINPRTIVLEEVPEYLKSKICDALLNGLKRLGYNVEHRLFCGKDYNELTSRTRVVIIASYDKIEFPEPEEHTVRVRDILLDPQDKRCNWFTPETKPYFFKEKKSKFIANRQEITKDTEFINTLPKRYLESQQQNPIVKHPTKPDTYRLLTAHELRIIAGLPESFESGSDWITGMITGQGVLVKLFTKIIGRLV